MHTSSVGFAMERKSQSDTLNKDALSIFTSSINAVLPHQMINKQLQVSNNGMCLEVDGRSYQLDNNVYVVGFGKAVSGMARAVDDILSQHIVTGIISIPYGCQQQLRETGKDYMVLKAGSKIQVSEGSKDNMPDDTSYQAALKIKDLVSKLKETDILIVLISGGGSALLPLPIPPVTLQEELELTKLMSKSGATIDDLNILRKNIEVLKGGGLAKLANPAQIIGLIMSDVIRDKLDIISSGPTVPDKSTPQQCHLILKQLGIQDKVPESIQTLLTKRARLVSNVPTASKEEETHWPNVQNIIVASNKIALQAASLTAEKMGYLPIVLSSVRDGDARKVGVMFGMMARYAALSFGYKKSNPRNSDYVQLEINLVSSGVPKQILKKAVDLADKAFNLGKPLCFMTGGETTVQVKGSGLGGRNLEMAVSCALELDKQCYLDTSFAANFSILFLSGGTDGQDGPTPVAGAMLDSTFIQQCRKADVDPLTYLENNDTYNLIKKVNKDCLIQIGQTGTNVMDIQVLIVKSR